jgi:hypothetical protein
VLFDTILPSAEFSERYAAELSKRPGFEHVLASQPRYIDLGEGLADPAESQRQMSEYEKATSRPWKSEEFPLAARWLKGNEQSLRIAEEASRRPKAYAPLISGMGTRSLANVLLPHVQRSRGVARGLVTRAMLHLGEGRNEAAWQDVMSMLRIAGHLERSATLIERLVAMAIKSMAQAPAVLCLSDPAVSKEVLQRRWAELADVLPASSRIASAIRLERFMSLDMMLGVRSGSVTLDALGMSLVGDVPDEFAVFDWKKAGRALESLLVRSGDINSVLEYLNTYFDAVDDAFAQPTYAQRKAAVDGVFKKFRIEQDLVGSAAAAFLLSGADGLSEVGKTAILRQFAAAFRQVLVAEGRMLTRETLLHAAIAAELVRRARGEDVTDGQELAVAGAELALQLGIEAPALIDPVTSRPFVVRRDESGLKIYSIGDNNVDELGRTFGDGPGTDDIPVVLKR